MTSSDPNSTLVIRDAGGDRDWAHARVIGTALQAAGIRVARIFGGSPDLRGSTAGGWRGSGTC